MKVFFSLMVAAATTICTMQAATAQNPKAGEWIRRLPVNPDPTKVVVPPGYKVEVFKAGLDTRAGWNGRGIAFAVGALIGVLIGRR